MMLLWFILGGLGTLLVLGLVFWAAIKIGGDGGSGDAD